MFSTNNETESREQFTYLWTNSKTKEYYIGSHFGDPDDGYICGNHELRKIIRENPEDWKRSIFKHRDCRLLEKAMLKALNASEDVRSYNQINHAAGIVKHSERSKELISQNHAKYWKGKKRPRHSEVMKGNTNRRRKCMHIPTGEVFDSLKEAAEEYNISSCCVSQHCKGKMRRPKFRYVESENN